MTAKRILVVEDEFLVALDMETILADAGFEVIGPVGGVAEALRLIERDRPAAALLDNNLNGEPVGPVADMAVRSMHVDLLFMGVHGMDERGGFTTPNLLESETNRALLRSARQLVVVADHTKWGIVGLSTIAELGQADVLVTDDGLPGEARATLAEHVGELMVAEQ